MTFPKLLIPVIGLLFICSSCNSPQTTSDSVSKITYPRMIGDLAYDPVLDKDDVDLCNDEDEAVQYYFYTNIVGEYPFQNEKFEVIQIFKNQYEPKEASKESGLIRIRFLVNCEGMASRYRIIGADKNYQEKTFDKSITDQLLSIIRNELKWKPLDVDGRKVDYYMYLVFKMEQGKIIEILP